MASDATPVGPGRFAVPGNRWDLLRDQSPPDDKVAEFAEVSVVVPFYQNQHDLDLLLAGLSVQTHPLSRLQVVIADDGSPTPPAVPDVAQGLDITIVRQEDAGFRAGAARNLGVTRTDGAVLLFLDGDTVPDPDYVRELARLPTLLPDAVVSGRRRYADLSRWSPSALLGWFAGQTDGPAIWEEPAWMVKEYERTGDLLSIHPRSYKYLIGAVLGFSREMFDELGGFDETITGYGGEDYDLTYRAFNAGAVMAFVPTAVAWHDGREWAGRTEPENRTPQKNREVLMLAERIPEPSMRGRGQIYAVPDVLATVHADGWALGAAVQCIRSLLTTLDCAVSIVGRTESTQALRAVFRSDPRVGPSTPEHGALPQPGSLLDDGRSRLHLSVCEAVVVTMDFADLLSRMLEEDVGSLAVTSDGRTILAAESNRRRARRRRHRHVPDAASQAWFRSVDLDVAPSGTELITGEPELAAIFGGYS
ncbi:GT2 family glycosyltransferase [Nakamurella sp. UYEF19]|uniref:glycosyltransferase family 2 protein n=1 Tax=Nakamurella sp. UYEF19 TaxID=1756392 RepID=UPI003395EB0A